MWLLVTIAWRNALRNKRRTLLSGLAIGLGLASLILADAFIKGMEQSMVRMATDTLMGQGQIHAENFRQSMDVAKTLHHGESVLNQLQQEPHIKAAAPRVLSQAMISSPTHVTGVLLYGIDPALEADVSKVDDFIVQGAYLDTDSRNKVLIGNELAEDLGVTLGDRLVITLAQARTGDLSQQMVRVQGIFHFNTREMDQGMVFVSLHQAQELLGIPNEIHEIAFHFDDSRRSRNMDAPFWDRYTRDGNVAEGWIEIMPELESLLKLSQFSIHLSAMILFGVVSFGIMNTLFTSLYERMFEFGVLRAIGTRPLRMALIVIFEAASIAVISMAIGILLGFVLTLALQSVGIDYSGLEFGGLTFREKLYPIPALSQYIFYPAWLFVFTVLVGFYPGWYAARLKPARAMRRSF